MSEAGKTHLRSSLADPIKNRVKGNPFTRFRLISGLFLYGVILPAESMVYVVAEDPCFPVMDRPAIVPVATVTVTSAVGTKPPRPSLVASSTAAGLSLK